MSEILTQLIEQGFLVFDASALDRQKLESVFNESRAFFSRPLAEKRRYSVQDGNHGYRPLGQEYSLDPSRPDMNDAFACWETSASKITNDDRIAPLLAALDRYRLDLVAIVNDVLTELAEMFSYEHSFGFVESSYIQVNSYNVATDRDLLQDRHEDGHLVTLISANAPGLEYFVDDEPMPSSALAGDCLLMPGSVLTDMTGGLVKPLYHQVRNHHNLERMAAMYFVNPNVSDELAPYVVNEYNRDLDIRKRVLENPYAFGLPAVPVSSSE